MRQRLLMLALLMGLGSTVSAGTLTDVSVPFSAHVNSDTNAGLTIKYDLSANQADGVFCWIRQSSDVIFSYSHNGVMQETHSNGSSSVTITDLDGAGEIKVSDTSVSGFISCLYLKDVYPS